MEASDKEIELFIQKKTSNLRSDKEKVDEANRIIRKLIVLKQLKDDVSSPIVQNFVKFLEDKALEHGKKALNGSKIEPSFSHECKCGEKIDMHKTYYKVYSDIHDMIIGFVDQWNKANSDIAKASRR